MWFNKGLMLQRINGIFAEWGHSLTRSSNCASGRLLSLVGKIPESFAYQFGRQPDFAGDSIIQTMDNGIQRVTVLSDVTLAFPSEGGGASLRPSREIHESEGTPNFSWSAWKRVIDICGSLILIALLSPLYLVVTGTLLLGGGNIVFRQTRIGRNGTQFHCYKFRTMVHNADKVLDQLLSEDPALREEWARFQKLSRDPRVTRLGRFLRKTSLDEIPQFFNVLKGDMSLVGPRPITSAELNRYGRSLRWYLSVRPGVTGLWQVKRKADTSYTQRVAMDAYYVRNRSLALDSWILLKTISAFIQSEAGG